jgi:group I intron endonuclease
MIGIYAITHRESGRVYIGSSVDIARRFSAHVSRLNNGKHCNQILQRAWSRYGSEAFTFSVVEVLDSADRLIEREQFHFEQSELVYNIGEFVGNPIRGTKRSAQWRSNMSAMMTAPEMREHMAKMVRSRRPPASAESRAKMSASIVERMKNPEAREKQRLGMLAVWARRSNEQRATMMAAMRARKRKAVA